LTATADAAAHTTSEKPLPLFVSAEAEARVMAVYRALLQHWPVPFETRMVPTRFGETHVISSGPADAPPLILMHAFFATALVWLPNIGELSAHHRVHVVDILGEPNPGRPVRPILTDDDAVRWYADLLDGLGVARASVIGNSNGGFLSALFAMKLPERFERLVLISPAATFHTIWPFYRHMFVPKLLALMAPWLPGHERRMRKAIAWAGAGLPGDPGWEELFFLELMYGKTATQVIPRVFTPQEAHAIRCPTLLIVGDHEVIYRPDAVIAAARALLPAIETAVVPDAHHVAALAQPEAVNRLILTFVNA
jgi:pimeloyl-ACP methyl ester carboxylesterase